MLLERLQDHASWHVRNVDMAGRCRRPLFEPAAFGQQFFQVGFDTWKLVRHLGLDVQPRLVGAALGDIDDLIQRQDLQAVVTVAGPVRVSLVEPRTGVQLLELRQGEGADRVFHPCWEHVSDVGGAFQHVIVQRYQHAVLGSLDVHFQVVRAQVARQGVGRNGFFRCVERSTAMGDHGWPGQAVFLAQHLAWGVRRRCHA